MSEGSDFLILSIDLNVLHTAKAAAGSVLQQILAFINAYTILHEQNKLVVLAVSSGGCEVIYSTPEDSKTKSTNTSTTQVVYDKVLELVCEKASAGLSSEAARMSGSLSRALCIINRHVRDASPLRGVKPRILCLVASADVSSQYVPFMNAIFSAQRLQVVIDACLLGLLESPFLQQATHITKGTYLRLQDTSVLLQSLLQLFAQDCTSRQWIQGPLTASVDFRASCFCHRKPRDLVHVCSICLSIFCERLPSCTTCGTAFSAPASQGSTGIT